MTTSSGTGRADHRTRVTVAIPTRDRPDHLCSVVRDIWAGRRRPDEILVVCQGDAPVEAARRLKREVPGAVPAVRFYASARHGTCANRNDIIRLATGDFIAFSDDDMSLPETWLESMLEIWAQDWECGAVLLTGPIQAPEEASNPLATPGRRLGATRRVWRTPPGSGDVLYGGHFGAPRSVYNRVGLPPFDERFGPGTRFPGAGDEEFALRVLSVGVPIAFEPSIEATHIAEAESWVQSQFEHCQGTGAMYVLRLSSGQKGALGLAVRAIFRVTGKAVRAAAAWRFRESVGRLAGVVGILYGAVRWWVTGAENEPRAPEPVPGELSLVQLD